MSLNKYNTGSSLIEVLVAIVIVGLVVTGAMMSISFSVRNSAEARYREVGTQLAQDGMEVIKLRREVDPWSTFYGDAVTGTRYICTNAIVHSGSECKVTIGNKEYTRTVLFTRDGTVPQTVRATVTVSWQSDANQVMDVKITQEFKERVI